MPETTVGTDLLQPLEVVTELGVDGVGQNLAVLAVDDIALPVQEPQRNLVLRGVLDDSDEALQLVRVELSGTVEGAGHVRVSGQVRETRGTSHAPLVEVDIGLLADQVGVPPTDTLDLRQGVHDLALAVNIGVEQTQNVL